jgi:hypothetical protein
VSPVSAQGKLQAVKIIEMPQETLSLETGCPFAAGFTEYEKATQGLKSLLSNFSNNDDVSLYLGKTCGTPQGLMPIFRNLNHEMQCQLFKILTPSTQTFILGDLFDEGKILTGAAILRELYPEQHFNSWRCVWDELAYNSVLDNLRPLVKIQHVRTGQDPQDLNGQGAVTNRVNTERPRRRLPSRNVT